MTKKTQIELIKAIMENTLRIYQDQKEKDIEWANELFHEYMGMQKCYDILTDKQYAKDLAEIYEVA